MAFIEAIRRIKKYKFHTDNHSIEGYAKYMTRQIAEAKVIGDYYLAWPPFKRAWHILPMETSEFQITRCEMIAHAA